MQYNITYRKKDTSWQYIISYKDNHNVWKQKSKQGFELNRNGKELCKNAAEKAVNELEKKVGLDIHQEYENITFEKYKEAFIEHEKLYKEPNTIEHYELTFNVFNGLNDLQVDKIGNSDIQKCVDDLIRSNYSEMSIKGFLASLHYIFNYALKKSKIISQNPVQDIEVKAKKEKSVKIALTKKQLKDLLSKIPNKKQHLISMIAAKCGLRISEIIGLTWADIDAKKHMLKVTKQWKRNTDGKYDFGIVKSKNSKREVPIPPDLMNEFKSYQSNQKVINLNDRIFNCSTREVISATLCNTYKRIGYDISVHELRHTYGTMLIANGLDFKTVATLMGDDVKQILDTYSHVTDDMMDHAKKLINKIM